MQLGKLYVYQSLDTIMVRNTSHLRLEVISIILVSNVLARNE